MRITRGDYQGRLHSLIIARVQRIATALLGTELQGEESILAPRYVGIHMNLVLRLGEMRKSLASNRTQIHLWPGSQVDSPEFTGRRRLGGTDQFVGCTAQKVTT